MINIKGLYHQTKLPVDLKLLDELIDKYLKISFRNMNNNHKETKDLLYSNINIITKEGTRFNYNDCDNFLRMVKEDYLNAGQPYDPSLYMGVKNPIRIMPGWLTFKSWYLLGTKKINSKDITHRFYFSVKNEDLYELATVLYNKFKSENIPFYFKTEANNGYERRDNIVLYTSTEFLEDTLNILGQIEKDKFGIFENFYDPSILVGKIDRRIGYATEDLYSNKSYTDLICESFLSSIENTLNDYMRGNYNPEIKRMFDEKLHKYDMAGIEINKIDVKYRILFDILIKNVPSIKNILLINFKNDLLSRGIDINNICFNDKAKREIKQLCSQNIILPNGTMMTEEEYLKRNNVLAFVPTTSIIKLKNGSIVSGDDFVKLTLKKAKNFNTFQELFMYYCESIKRENNFQSGLRKKL